jgi:hypothetical protein
MPVLDFCLPMGRWQDCLADRLYRCEGEYSLFLTGFVLHHTTHISDTYRRAL